MEWLCIDFLNSDWRDWRGTGNRRNRLENVEWLEYFLQKWNLTAPIPVEEAMGSALLAFRNLLRQMVEEVVQGQVIRAENIAELNRVLALAPSHQRMFMEGQNYRLEQVSSHIGWESVMVRIAESFAELLVHQDLRRLKICDNNDCQWVFFDESRNRVRRWCDDKACGNLMKVRRFRERQKEKGEAE